MELAHHLLGDMVVFIRELTGIMPPSIPPTPTGTDLSGKTIIITGGNSGLGFETARQFLTLKASRLIITVRSKAKGENAIATLKADRAVQLSNPDAVVEAFDLDLDDYQSGVKFVRRVEKEVKELDILLCNGGMNNYEYQTSKSGHERIMQVNCYTHFLVALELIPLLRSTASIRGVPSRVSFVSSYSSKGDSYNSLSKDQVPPSDEILAYLDDRKSYDWKVRYGDSKFVTNAFMRCLAASVPSNEVVVNSLCPGAVKTSLGRNFPAWLRIWLWMYITTVGRPVEEGSRTIVYSTVVSGQETHGMFLQHNRIDTDALLLDEPASQGFISRLWEEMVAEVRREDPGFNIWT